MTAIDARFAQQPVYAVVFDARAIEDPYEPLISFVTHAGLDVTVPHGFDREVAAVMAGLWYCLHLPRTLADLVDLDARRMKAMQELHLEHHVFLVPVQLLEMETLAGRLTHGVAVLAVCPDDLLHETAQRCDALGFVLPPASFSQLGDDTLRDHWRAMHDRLIPDTDYLGRELTLTCRLDVAATELPRRFLVRQFGSTSPSPNVAASDIDALMAETVRAQVVLAATARLEREQVAVQAAEELFLQTMVEEHARLRVPVAVALPGVAPAYARTAYDSSVRERIRPLAAVDPADTWAARMGERDDALVERTAIEFVTTHRATARGGIGLMLPSLPPEAFTILAELERHFLTPVPRGAVVWRLLDRLNAATASLWTPALMQAVVSASTLTVFSNFPLGLLRLPGDSSPLSTRVPIAYRPLLPLTRTLQAELNYLPALDLSEHVRVLVAECIPANDPVGALSRAGWDIAEEIPANAADRLTLTVVEALSVDALQAAITEYEPQILIISAHGVLSPTAMSPAFKSGMSRCSARASGRCRRS